MPFTLPTPPTPPTIVPKPLKAVVTATNSSTHGGVIPTGDPTPKTASMLHVARETDEFICGISAHNPTTLAPVLNVFEADDLNALKNLDMTLCGAQVIATQTVLMTEQVFIRVTSPSTV